MPGLQVGHAADSVPRCATASKGLEQALDELCRRRRARPIEDEDVNILILSDRGVNAENAPIPALLAVAGLHHHLIREGTRTRVGLVLESGEPREVHHFALLIGYGCGAINPYLAFETIDDMIREGLAHEHRPRRRACKNFVKAATKGVVKVMSKMGISTIQSYRGAQIFEAVGLQQDVIDQYFTWTAVAHRRRRPGRHRPGSADAPSRTRFPSAQVERPRARRRRPVPVARGRRVLTCSTRRRSTSCRIACRTNNYAVFKEYAQLIDDQSKNLCTLRGLLDFKPADAGAARGSRVGREHREALQDGRDVATARSARKRTRRWPSR